MPSDPLLTFLAEALAEEDHIQGFTYAGCVIRNVAKRWAEQEIWHEAGTDDAAQARMARRVEVERLKPVRRRLEAHRQPVPWDGGGGQGSAGSAPSSGGLPQ